MDEVAAVVTVNCPWCDEVVALEASEVVRCDGCSVQVELAPEPAVELALAA